MPFVDKGDVKLGFWISIGVLLALLIWGFLMGAAGKLRVA